jgi:hypothetical protein
MSFSPLHRSHVALINIASGGSCISSPWMERPAKVYTTGRLAGEAARSVIFGGGWAGNSSLRLSRSSRNSGSGAGALREEKLGCITSGRSADLTGRRGGCRSTTWSSQMVLAETGVSG